MSRDFTGLSPSIVCAPLKAEHDAVVAMRGRPFTDDGMVVKSAGLPDAAAVSLIDTYINDKELKAK